jgi:hypothetical protein
MHWNSRARAALYTASWPIDIPLSRIQSQTFFSASNSLVFTLSHFPPLHAALGFFAILILRTARGGFPLAVRGDWRWSSRPGIMPPSLP